MAEADGGGDDVFASLLFDHLSFDGVCHLSWSDGGLHLKGLGDMGSRVG